MVLVSILGIGVTIYFIHIQENRLLKLYYSLFYDFSQSSDLPKHVTDLDFQEQLDLAKKEILNRRFNVAYDIFEYISTNSVNWSLREESEFYKRMVLYKKIYMYDIAIRELEGFIEEFLRYDSKYIPHAHFHVGRIYYDKKKDRKAVEHFMSILKKYSTHDLYPKAVNYVTRIINRQKQSKESQSVVIIAMMYIIPNNWPSFLIHISTFFVAIAWPLSELKSMYYKKSRSSLNQSYN